MRLLYSVVSATQKTEYNNRISAISDNKG
jgi:hypothetical protein